MRGGGAIRIPEIDQRVALTAGSVPAHASGERVMIASDPMYAFRAGYQVPPALANLCQKRIATDSGLARDVRTAFAEHPAALVLIAAGAPARLVEWMRQGMGDRYRLRSAEEGTQLYVR